MKKIIASILAAFFVLLSPLSAYASTTESMMLFANTRAFPSTFNYTIYSGVYNKFDESFDFVSLTSSNLTNGSLVYPAGDWFGQSYHLSYDKGDMPVFGFSVGDKSSSSSISIPDGSTLIISVNDLAFDLRPSNSPNLTEPYYSLSSELAVPYKVYADMYFTATRQDGTLHQPTYYEQTVEVTNFLRPANNPYTSQPIAFDIESQISISADTSGFTGDRLYNINLRYIKVYAVYDFSQFVNPDSGVKLINQISVGNIISYTSSYRNLGVDNLKSSFISINYSGGTGNDSIISSNIIQSSISSLGSNITNSMNQVKTQVTQSANTITTRIQTMETNVVDGLNNVISSAQQNTQNIINTVTQKVDQVKETVTEVKDSILDLPNKIQEMLLGLIVPDSDTMADKYSEFSGLLEEKLGVIYQIPMMLFDFFDTIVNAATTPQTTLTLPAFQLPWIDGSTLTVWQPMEYRIIPEGMQVLSDLIKTITSMTVVVLTFNSVKRAYERFLRS